MRLKNHHPKAELCLRDVGRQNDDDDGQNKSIQINYCKKLIVYYQSYEFKTARRDQNSGFLLSRIPH